MAERDGSEHWAAFSNRECNAYEYSCRNKNFVSDDIVLNCVTLVTHVNYCLLVKIVDVLTFL